MGEVRIGSDSINETNTMAHVFGTDLPLLEVINRPGTVGPLDSHILAFVTEAVRSGTDRELVSESAALRTLRTSGHTMIILISGSLRILLWTAAGKPP